MLYTHPSKPPQLHRRCLHLSCGTCLEIPTTDHRAAFCCESCQGAYFATRCLVCNTVIRKKSRNRQVCERSKCRHALQRHPETYRLRLGQGGPKSLSASKPHKTTSVGQIAEEIPAKSTAKFAEKSGRGWRVIAGPADGLHPINLRAHPADAAAARTGRPSSTLIKRDTFPVNIIGGYRFPNAPKISLFEEPTTSVDPEDRA